MHTSHVCCMYVCSFSLPWLWPRCVHVCKQMHVIMNACAQQTPDIYFLITRCRRSAELVRLASLHGFQSESDVSAYLDSGPLAVFVTDCKSDPGAQALVFATIHCTSSWARIRIEERNCTVDPGETSPAGQRETASSML